MVLIDGQINERNNIDALIERHWNRFDVPLLTEIVHQVLETQNEWRLQSSQFATVGEYLDANPNQQPAITDAVVASLLSAVPSEGQDDPFEVVKEAICDACEFISNFIDSLPMNFDLAAVKANHRRMSMSDIEAMESSLYSSPSNRQNADEHIWLHEGF